MKTISKEQRSVKDLGTEKVSALLYRYSMPAIIAMTASSLYNMVDSIFIGQGVGSLAISGLAVTFPLMNLSTAFGTLVGVGCATITSILLGKHDYANSRQALKNEVIMNIVVGLMFMVVALIFLDPILRFFGASDATLPYAREYMEIILYGNVVTHLYFGLNAMLRTAGHPKLAMSATILTVTLNAVLDPIFIFTFGLGIRGAAIATVIAQCVSLVWVARIFFKKDKNNELRFEGAWRFDLPLARQSIKIGLAPFLMNVGQCIVVIFLNRQLINRGGDVAIGAYGIINRLVFICIMIVMGFNQGMQPIVGYNYGAGQYDRVKQAFKTTALNATYVMSAFFLLSMLLPDLMVRVFTHDQELIDVAAQGLRITVCMFPLIGFQMVTSNYFQSLGMANKAIFLSLSRQFLFLIPFLILFPHLWGMVGVWWSMPVSDLISTAVAYFMLRKLHKYNL